MFTSAGENQSAFGHESRCFPACPIQFPGGDEIRFFAAPLSYQHLPDRQGFDLVFDLVRGLVSELGRRPLLELGRRRWASHPRGKPLRAFQARTNPNQILQQTSVVFHRFWRGVRLAC
jgi:hypothetical protein